MRIILLTFFLSLFFSCKLAADISIYSINDLHGIAIRETRSICQDSDGFIWAASRNGILKITDGYCKVYKLQYKNANVGWTKVAFKHHLYVYTNNGQIYVYNTVKDSFEQIADLKNLSDNKFFNIYDLLEDDFGNVWISSFTGLYQYNGTMKKVKPGFANIALYDKTHLLLGYDNRLELLNLADLQSRNLLNVKLQITSLCHDKKSNFIWIGTREEGLFYFDVKQNKLNEVSTVPSFPRQPILSIESNSPKSILVGTDGKGIWEISKDGKKVLHIYKEDANNPFSLRGNGVYNVFTDRDKRVWISTFTGGLSYFDPQVSDITQIKHELNRSNSLGDNNVNNILEDNKGNIWIATNNGVNRWNRKRNVWQHYYQDKEKQSSVFMALCQDHEGHIWAGSYSSGIHVFDPISNREITPFFSSDKNADLIDKYVLTLFKDSEGDIWVGSARKDVVCCSTRDRRLKTYRLPIVSAFAELSPGKILAASFNNLILLDKATGVTKPILTDYIIRSIFVQKNVIWIATAGYGLIRYDYQTKKEQIFTTKSGLLSDDITNIVYSNGNLILTTENGLCRLNLQKNTIFTLSPSAFTPNTLYLPQSSAKLKNGDILLGSNNGMFMLNPAIIKNDYRKRSEIFMQDIKISGQSLRDVPGMTHIGIPVNHLKLLSLKYNQNNLTVELVPVGSNSANNKFSWKLEGFEKEWNKPSSLHTVTYTNLPPGKFKLVIRMYDPTLSKMMEERALGIHISSPFWQTWWFYMLAAIAIIALVLYLAKVYSDQLKQKHAKDKIRFFTNMAHDIRTSLTLINGPIHEIGKNEKLSEKSCYYLNTAQEQTKKLLSVATQLLDFQRSESGREHLTLAMTDIVILLQNQIRSFDILANEKNIDLVFESESSSYVTAIDEQKMEKVIENLLSNAIKYSLPDSTVRITLHCNPQRWLLIVSDNGIGISEAATRKLFSEFYRGENAINSKIIGSGIGLLIIRDYVAMHKGKVTVSSKEGAGSTFSIEVPYQETDVQRNSSTDRPVLTPKNPNHLMELPSSSEKKTLLVVDDNNGLRNFLKNSLQKQYNIITACDGEKAWDTIRSKNLDMVVSDVMMPNMNGFELCKLIKSTFETSHIPIILLTALSEKTRQLEGLGLGADDYIVKPFEMDVLMQRITTILKNRELVTEKALKMVKPSNENVPIFSNELNDKFIKRAMEVVRENISDSKFGRDEFASMMNISSSLLYNKLKSLSGQSPIEFIKNIRLNHAADLLLSRKYTITEVSDLCGFSSVSYFSTVFKNNFSKSPSEWIAETNNV